MAVGKYPRRRAGGGLHAFGRAVVPGFSHLFVPVLLGALSGCSLVTSSDDGPSTIVLSRTAFALDAVGASESLRAEVRSSGGGVLAGEPVEWASSDLSVATVGPTGVVTAVRNGTARITATSGRASAVVDVTVEQIATAIEKVSGDGQSGAVGEALPSVVVVRAYDRLGSPAANVPVEFQVLDGGGSATPVRVRTGVDGTASATWVLGPVAHAEQSLRSFLVFRVGEGVIFEAEAGPGVENRIVVVSGDDQAAPRLSILLRPLVVRVEDRLGNPVSGVAVQFSVLEGGGSVQPQGAGTDEDGRASTLWTLGGLVGTQRVSVTAGALAAIAFSANATLPPESVQIVGGDDQTGIVGQPVAEPPAVRVLGPGGVPLAGLDVEFAVSTGGGLLDAGPGDAATVVTVRTGADGVAAVDAWILGPAPGEKAVTVSVPGLPPVGFTSEAEPGPPAALVKVSGDRQIGVAGAQLPVALVVEVSDALGNRLAGVTVSFARGAGSGSVVPSEVDTGANGTASAEWTLGLVEGPHSVVASIAAGLSVTFTATATGEDGLGLQIQLQFIDQPAGPQLASFQAATSRWAGAIPGGLGPQPVQLPAGACGGSPPSPAVNAVVEDVLVFVRLETIDGIGGVLGTAGVCAVRAATGLPLVSHVRLDLADVVRLQAGNRLVDLILHELGHALGFGTLWSAKGLLVNPSLPVSRGADTHFSGSAAVQAFNAVGGNGYTGGQKVPVENQEGGPGTRDSHWRSSVFKNELMTGFLTTGVNPLSRVTIASFGDLGYQVDQGAADPFQLTGLNAPPQGPEAGPVPDEVAPIPFGDDVERGPIYVVGEDGRIQGKLGGP